MSGYMSATPWRCEKGGVVDADGKSVAIITPRLDWPDMTAMRVHGPLIASAPDLLERGQRLQQARERHRIDPTQANADLVRARSDAFDAAIEKATGAKS